MLDKYDEIVIGAGIMGMVYTYFLKQVLPEARVLVIESLDEPAKESSNAWNNAGTWHGANCEANYTPEINGQLDISKALSIHSQAVQSLEFLVHLIDQGYLKDPKDVITRESHVSLMLDGNNRKFLKERFEKMRQHHFFESMQYSEDLDEIAEWTAKLITAGRDKNEKISATMIFNGAGLNFGAFTKTVYAALQGIDGVYFKFSTPVQQIQVDDSGPHKVKAGGEIYQTDKIFIGAGGGSLPLLQKTKTPESKRYAGFPVGGQFLVCEKPEVVKQLQAKIYGKASVGAPPMSVPHFDSRYIDGKHYILFGPKALFNPKFLINGSYLDLFKSIRIQNIWAMLQVALKEFNLVTYLIRETFSGKTKLFKALQQFYPEAKPEDWRMHTAGQRVQVIKRSEIGKGELKLGTEVVVDSTHSIGALLGASPGASVAVAAMLDLLEQLHPSLAGTSDWLEKIQTIIPTYRQELVKNADLYRAVRGQIDPVLGLDRE